MCRPAFLREAAKFEPQIRCQILHSLNSEISNSQILNYNEDHP
jgi:hypothetical protein